MSDESMGSLKEFLEKNQRCVFENDRETQLRMWEEKRPYRAVFFDLDGTLLPMDIGEFLLRYYQRLGVFIAEEGYDAKLFSGALNKGIGAMSKHGPCQLNSEAFWEVFLGLMAQGTGSDNGKEWEGLLNRFYGDQFDLIGKDTVPNPASARAVNALAEKGYPMALTTMPLFPREAVEARLGWAGVDPIRFQRLTTYDNSSATKPSLLYFAENLAAAGVDAKDVLMVGNNTLEDLSFMELGVDVFLVTDELLNPNDFDVNSVRHGTMEEFAAWVETLPTCADPVPYIEPGPIDFTLREECLARYGLDTEAASSLKTLLPRMDGAADEEACAAAPEAANAPAALDEKGAC